MLVGVLLDVVHQDLDAVRRAADLLLHLLLVLGRRLAFLHLVLDGSFNEAGRVHVLVGVLLDLSRAGCLLLLLLLHLLLLGLFLVWP